MSLTTDQAFDAYMEWLDLAFPRGPDQPPSSVSKAQVDAAVTATEAGLPLDPDFVANTTDDQRALLATVIADVKQAGDEYAALPASEKKLVGLPLRHKHAGAHREPYDPVEPEAVK